MASPQVRTIEYDLSQRVAAYPGMYGLILGAFDRGPVGKRTMITSGVQMDQVLGKPKIGSDMAYMTAQSFLSKSKRMWAVRIASDDALYGGVSVGAKFNVPLGMGNGTNRVFSGVLPFNRCHPNTVDIFIDAIKVGYDVNTGAGVTGQIQGGTVALGTVNYETGEVSVEFDGPVPNRAIVYARWGLPNVGFTAGMLEPAEYDFDGRVVTQQLSHTAEHYIDNLAPDTLVTPLTSGNTSAEATVRLYSGSTLIGWFNDDSQLIDAGSYFDLSQPNSINYSNGRIEFHVATGSTLTTPITAQFRSYKAEACLFSGDNPGSWTDDYSLTFSSIDPILGTFNVSLYERDSRGIMQRKDSYLLSRVHQKDSMERSMYLEEKLNGKSYYLRAFDNPNLSPTECLVSDSLDHNSTAQMVLVAMSGGSKGSAPSVAHYIQALKKFNNKEDVKVDIVIDSLGDHNYQLEITKLCDRDFGGRADCYGILYAPFELEESNNYVDDLVNYRKYTLNITSSFVGLYAGHVKIYDGYNGRDLWIPNVGFVAAAFSYTADQYEPWFPAAGWRRGVLPVLDVYRRFSLGERDVLYDNDINVIRFRPGKGIAIWGQKTMYGRASALDRANVRWLLIVIQNAIEEYLEEFEFELNDSSTRSLLRSGVHDYLQSIKNRRGVYDFDVVCDDSNNTAEQIDQYLMQVDYYVQPTKAAEYINGRAVITRTGVNFDDVRITN